MNGGTIQSSNTRTIANPVAANSDFEVKSLQPTGTRNGVITFTGGMTLNNNVTVTAYQPAIAAFTTNPITDGGAGYTLGKTGTGGIRMTTTNTFGGYSALCGNTQIGNPQALGNRELSRSISSIRSI